MIDKYITLQRAAALMSDDDREVHWTSVLYAANVGLLSSIQTCHGTLVDREEVEARIHRGVKIPRLQDMIKKDLSSKGIWEPSWNATWEEAETPLTEQQFEEYERKRLARKALKHTQTTIWDE